MTARDRNAVLIGLGVLGIAWMGFRGAPAGLARIRTLEDEVQQRIDLVERARHATSNLQPLSDSIAHLEGIAQSLHRVILMGGEPTTATFDLTRRLTESLNRTAAFVGVIEPAADSAGSGVLRRVSVLASLETDIVGLVEILTRLDGDSTLAAESLDVTATATGTPPHEVERLDVLLGVSGWYVPDTILSPPKPDDPGP